VRHSALAPLLAWTALQALISRCFSRCARLTHGYRKRTLRRAARRFGIRRAAIPASRGSARREHAPLAKDSLAQLPASISQPLSGLLGPSVSQKKIASQNTLALIEKKNIKKNKSTCKTAHNLAYGITKTLTLWLRPGRRKGRDKVRSCFGCTFRRRRALRRRKTWCGGAGMVTTPGLVGCCGEDFSCLALSEVGQVMLLRCAGRRSSSLEKLSPIQRQ